VWQQRGAAAAGLADLRVQIVAAACELMEHASADADAVGLGTADISRVCFVLFGWC
jgi:hypothetical protein